MFVKICDRDRSAGVDTLWAVYAGVRLGLSSVLLLGACGGDHAGFDGQAGAAEAVGPEQASVLGAFLNEHWQLPVAPQGDAPAEFSGLERSLDPVVCGACHPEQHAAWQTSLHAAAYSPGLAGQLVEGPLADPAEVRSCQSCHAPLGEQQPYTEQGRHEVSFDPSLRAQGIACAACHVRKHRRFGPPRRAGVPPVDSPAHAGFEARNEFQESRFCARCHQFFDDPGANGKPLENTFVEWQQSPQAAAGRQCQDCHMPDRAHLWRGIHDPNMVRAAVDLDLVPQDLGGEVIRAALVVRNRDVGHAFPTYVTPRIELAVYQLDAAGLELGATRLEALIGREVDLATMTEIFDTRVLPGESVKLDYALARATGAVALLGRVRVDPDYHYRGVFESLLASLGDKGARAQIMEARRRISTSTYVLAEIRRSLPAN